MIKIIIRQGDKEFRCELPTSPEQDVDVYMGRRIPILKRRQGKWFKKSEPCNRCGVCCIIKTSSWIFGFKRCEEGPLKGLPVCTRLQPGADDTYFCNADYEVPIGCLRAYSPTDPKELFYCSVLYSPLIDVSKTTPEEPTT